jgi:hypothetical protein
MPLQILNELGQGEQLGQMLRTGLQGLAQSKLQQMQQSKMAGALQSLVGDQSTQQQKLSAIASLPVELQKVVLQNIDQILAQPDQGQQQAQGEFGIQAQAPMQQQFPQAPQKKLGGLFTSPAQRIQEERLGVEKEKVAQRQQMAIDERAHKFLTEVKKDSVPAQKIRYTVNNIMDLLESGEAQTGLTGRFLPKELQNETTQVLRTAINDLVLAKAAVGTGGGKGVMSKARLALEQLSKPDIWQQPGAMRRNLQNIINDPTLMKALAESQASEELKKEWGGVYPRDYESKIESRTQQIMKEQKAEQKLKKMETGTALIKEVQDKYPASQYPGKIIKDADSGLRVISRDGKWEIYKG